MKSSRFEPWFRGKFPPLLIAIVLLAGALRFGYWLEAKDLSLFQVPTGDAATNVWLADQLAQDGILAPQGEPYERAPLYPFFLWILREAGVGLGGVRGIQFLLGVAGVVLLWILGRRVAGRIGAVTAALGGALFGPFLFFESDLLSIALGVFLLEAALVLWGRPRWALAVGLLLGGAALVQPNFLAAGMIAAAASLLRPQAFGWPSRRAAILLAAGLVFPILLTTARNVAVTGEPIAISTNGGINFYIGNNPSANGTFILPPDSGLLNRAEGLFTSAREVAERETGRALNHRGVDRFWWLRGLDFWLTHPGRALGLTGMKTLLALNNAEVPSHYDYDFFKNQVVLLRVLPMMGLLLPLGAIGLVLLWRRGERVWGLFFLSLLIAIIPFFITGRYRLPLAVLLLPAAGVTLERAWSLRHRPERLRWVGAGAVTALVLAFLPLYHGGLARAHMLNVEGAALVVKGDLPGARASFEAALELNPNHAEALNNLAYVHELRGDLVTALNTYRRALTANPTQAETYLNIEELYRKSGRAKEAMEILDKLEEARGGRTADVAGALAFRRAVNTLALGDTVAATSRFEEAVAADPRHSGAWLTLSMLLRRLKENDEALNAAKKAAELSPQAPEVQVNLGRCFENLGQIPEAIAAYSAAVQAGGASPELYYRLGTLLESQGRGEEAEQALLMANQGKPHAPALYALGLHYEQIGRLDDARLAYDTLVKLAGPEADQAKARLRGLR